MKKHILLFIILLIFPSTIWALERFEIITTAEMEQMLRDRENGKLEFVLVNGLDKMIYMHSAIPGSINIPLSSYEKYSDKLGRTRINSLFPTEWATGE